MDYQQPLANGLHTDHPHPDLPFVDDSHIPVHDAEALEAVGRGAGEGMWGRFDGRPDGEWQGFTTDPHRTDLAWCVRHHPEFGRAVLLYRNEDASPLQSDWWEERPLLYRAGGYWFDGEKWYRPGQVWDSASEAFDRRPARSPVTVTADDLLDGTCRPTRGRVVKVANFDPKEAVPGRWVDHLALWAKTRAEYGDARPLSQCIVSVSAPELAGDQLLSASAMAEIGGIAASTLRAYLSRGEGDVPPPQATVAGRPAWARPVAEDWAEQRRRSPESVAATVAGAFPDVDLPVGLADIGQRLARMFFTALWDNPARRKRWALRHRTEDAVGAVASDLGAMVVGEVRSGRMIPLEPLCTTIRHALLDELATCKDLHSDGDYPPYLGIVPTVTKMLDWLVRHHPEAAQHVIGETIGQAERRLQLPRELVSETVRRALELDSELPPASLREFLDRALPPART